MNEAEQLINGARRIAEQRHEDEEKFAQAQKLAQQVLDAYPGGAPETVLIENLTSQGVQSSIASYAIWNLYTFEDGQGVAKKDYATGVVTPMSSQ